MSVFTLGDRLDIARQPFPIPRTDRVYSKIILGLTSIDARKTRIQSPRGCDAQQWPPDSDE